MNNHVNDEEFVSAINEKFDRLPFNEVLGLKAEFICSDFVKTCFYMRDQLIGNDERGILHGGVISSVIDATGGLAAIMGLQKKMHAVPLEEKLKKLNRVSTIDLRVDFLHPGVGSRYIVSAHNLRTGNRVVVTRIELHNDKDDLIAVGTGSYILSG